jgi:hypothetical protein
MHTVYTYICIPADVVAAAVTRNAINKKHIPNYKVRVHHRIGDLDENIVGSNAILSGLDSWYTLCQESGREADPTLYFIKTLTKYKDEEFLKEEMTADEILSLLPTADAYMLNIEAADKYAAHCRAVVLYDAEEHITTRSNMEEYLEHYNLHLQSNCLMEQIYNHPSIKLEDLFSTKFVHKTFSKLLLTNTCFHEPKAQADVTDYIDYISDYLQHLETSINLHKDNSAGTLKGYVSMFGTGIKVPVELDHAFSVTTIEIIAKWIQGDISAEYEILHAVAENNHKIAMLMCIEKSLKHIVEPDYTSYDDCRVRIELPAPILMSWLKANDSEAYNSLQEELQL